MFAVRLWPRSCSRLPGALSTNRLFHSFPCRVAMAPSTPDEASSAPSEVPVKFGKWDIDPREIFAETELSLGIVNLKPVVPGHVLVISRRVAPRFADLSSAEVSDLWLTAQSIGRIVESAYGATSTTFTIQDGAEAGQTVPHVHVHIMPRKKGDFEMNDQIYTEIEKNERGMEGDRVKMDAEEDRKERSMAEMEEEALRLKSLIEEDADLKGTLGAFVRASSKSATAS